MTVIQLLLETSNFIPYFQLLCGCPVYNGAETLEGSNCFNDILSIYFILMSKLADLCWKS